MAQDTLDLQGERINLTPEEIQEEEILNSLKKVVNEYSMIYDTIDAEDILKDIESNPDKINALTNAINDIGAKEGLDLNGAKDRYEAYMSDDFNINGYVQNLVEKNDKDSLSSFLGAQALSLSDTYKEHQNLKTQNLEYSSNVTDYNNIQEKWNKLCEEYGDPPMSIVEDWNTERDSIYQNLEGTPMERMINTSTYSDINNTLKGLENSRENKQEQNIQTQDTQSQNTQLQTTNNDSRWQTIKNKLKEIGESLKGIFGGTRGFEKEVIQPAEEQLENVTQETDTGEKNLLSGVKEFLDKNVKSKIGNLKEKGLDGLEDLKDKIFGDQDLGELSQNFLDAKENGDTDQMARLSKQIVKINAEQEPQKYKEMSEEQMYNYSLSSGLAALDTEAYRETLSEEELKNSDTILEAMGIASRENYLNNDFDTNGQLLSERLLNIKEEQSVGPNYYYGALNASINNVDTKYHDAKNTKLSNLEFMERFEHYDDIDFDRMYMLRTSYGDIQDKFNSLGLNYLKNVKNIDTTEAKEYLDKIYPDDDHEFYTQLPEDLLIEKQEEKVPWEGRNPDRY